MPYGQPDLEPGKEFSLNIQAGQIYDEVTRDIECWLPHKESELYVSEPGPTEVIRDCSPLVDLMLVGVGSKSLGRHTDERPSLRLETVIYLEPQSDELNRGYLSTERAKQLVTLLEQKGCANVSLIEFEEFSSFRSISFEVRGQKFNLDIGPRSLEEDLALYQKYKYGDPPTHNKYLHIKPAEGNKEFPQEKRQFVESCLAFGQAASTVIPALHEVFGIKTPTSQVELLSPAASRRKEQQAHGYAITTYEDGEYHWDGKKAEPVYRPADGLAWREGQRRIFENRGLGNRQIVTIFKDRAILGRWGGVEAGDQQADILIDEDIDPASFDIKQERAVSRRHCAIEFNAALNENLAKATEGKVGDVVVIEDLHSANGTFIFRRTPESAALFDSQGSHEEIQNGGKTVLLPGDLLLVAGSDTRQYLADGTSAFFEGKAVGLIYLGQRKFVKLLIGQGATSEKEVLEDLIAVAAPPEQAGALYDHIDEIIASSGAGSVLDQAAKALEDYEGGSGETLVELTAAEVTDKKPEQLLKILAAGLGKEAGRKNCLTVIENAPRESAAADYAALQLTSSAEVTPEQLAILRQPSIWRSASLTTCLHLLDLVEISPLSPQDKSNLLNMVYGARDDFAKEIIRLRRKNLPEPRSE